MEWYGVVEWVKNFLWFGNLERKKSDRFVKKVCICE